MKVSSFHRGSPFPVTDVSGEWRVRSPSNLDQELGQVAYSYSHISTIVSVLHESQEAWKGLTFAERKAQVLLGIDAVLKCRGEWFQSAQAELGRTSVDLEAEWNQFELFVQHFKKIELDSPNERHPRGLVAILGSYIWPLVHTLQSTCLALLAGNAVVLKPSEKATLCSLKFCEWMNHNPKLKNVFSLLVGDRELGRRLVCHEGVQTVLFYGSFEVGMRVRQDTFSQPAKEVLLCLGAKNPSIVMDDAPDHCVEALVRDAFLSTGQHCRSISQIWIQEKIYSDFVKKFHNASKLFKIGNPAEGSYAGPLIDPSMLDRYLKFSGISEREGAAVLMRGKPLDSKLKGNYVTPTLAAFEKVTPELLRKSVSLQTEILSPHVSLLKFESEEELIDCSKEMTHGLVSSVWTGTPDVGQRIASKLPFGSVSINQSVLSWNPARSFQAMKKSGNHAYQGSKLLEQFTILKLSS